MEDQDRRPYKGVSFENSRHIRGTLRYLLPVYRSDPRPDKRNERALLRYSVLEGLTFSVISAVCGAGLL